MLVTAIILAVLLLGGCGNKRAVASKPDSTPAATAHLLTRAPDTVDFHTVDLTGKPVSEAIFTQADHTLVMVWATDCGPCKAGLKHAADLPASLEGLQVLGIVADEAAQKDPSLALQLMQAAGADFPVLLLSASLADGLLKGLERVPAFYLINRQGSLLAGPEIGALSQAELMAWVRQAIDSN